MSGFVTVPRGSVFGVEKDLLPVAIVTVEGGVDLVPVAERDGELVDRRSGAPIDLVSLVVVLGLAELSSAA